MDEQRMTAEVTFHDRAGRLLWKMDPMQIVLGDAVTVQGVKFDIETSSETGYTTVEEFTGEMRVRVYDGRK